MNKLTSIKTQLSYTYYSLPFCKPDAIVDSAENLGEVLRGDRIENSINRNLGELRLILVFTLHCRGWVARDLSMLSCVSNVLLPLAADNTIKQPTHVTIPKDCFEILGSLSDQTYRFSMLR